MQTFKPAGGELEILQIAARTLKESNLQVAAAEKAVDAAKAQLIKWLKEERKLDLDALEIGEVINIEGVALIKIGSMNKFDARGFQLAEAELYKKWVKSIPVKRFDPQV